jgi:hypothetical protein
MGIGGMQDDSYGGRTDMCNEAVAKDKYHDEHLGRASMSIHTANAQNVLITVLCTSCVGCASHPPDDFMGLEKLYRAFESFYVEMRTSGTLSKLFPLLSQVPNKSAARIFEEIIWCVCTTYSIYTYIEIVAGRAGVITPTSALESSSHLDAYILTTETSNEQQPSIRR